LPLKSDWRTTDEDELERRRHRAREETFRIVAEDTTTPVFGRYAVTSDSGMTYAVEIRDIGVRSFACTCRDYSQNGLRSCKHVEATLLWLQRRGQVKKFREAEASGWGKAVVGISEEHGTLRIEVGGKYLPASFAGWFDGGGDKSHLADGISPEEAGEALGKSRSRKIWIGAEVATFLESRAQVAERRALRRDYDEQVRSGEWDGEVTLHPLYPYQREGMLHLAFSGRAMLADEMGLGKTVQAIAAAALLARLGKVRRVLIVCPASLKAEWQEQIEKFSSLTHAAVFGPAHVRLRAYRDEDPPFFLIMNYEQILRDGGLINANLQPDLVILDEAQRIKNWTAKTAQAIKRLESPYAFALTGTPLENRIDELYSLIEFLDPNVFGSLFRFNRDFYKLDEDGKPVGYRNLGQMRERIAPVFLRRRKSAVEDSIPERNDRTLIVDLTPAQRRAHDDHGAAVAVLSNKAKRRSLTKEEHDKLMRELAMMRMSCDTNFILDTDDLSSSKIPELAAVLDEILAEPENKVIIFSEWVRMLEQLRDEVLVPAGVGFAWHTGKVPQPKRRGEINRFKTEPECRVFLTSDCGGTGLNLQVANFVINCDLPWNPAKLEQRIARAWRKHQTRPVTVINIVAKDSIEQRMIGTLSHKQRLADGVLDSIGDLDEMATTGGRTEFYKRLEAVVGDAGEATEKTQKDHPEFVIDPGLAFAKAASADLGDGMVSCEEVFADGCSGSKIIVVVKRGATLWKEKLVGHFEQFYGGSKSDPLFPVEFEVIDSESKATIDRLVEAGLLQPTLSNTRQLGGEGGLGPLARTHAPDEPPEEDPGPPPLTPEEQADLAAQNTAASRSLKLGRVLLGADFPEEARPHLIDSLRSRLTAISISERLEIEIPVEEEFLIDVATSEPFSNLLPEKLGSALSSGSPAAFADALENEDRVSDDHAGSGAARAT